MQQLFTEQATYHPKTAYAPFQDCMHAAETCTETQNFQNIVSMTPNP